MARTSTEHWVALIVVAVGLIPVGILGLFAYMSATATPLHPEPQRAPSVTHADPPPEWATAAERGRDLVRAALSAQNLPGLSAAVGVGGDVVWAEGFGWADLERRVPVTPGTLFRIGTASKALTSAAVGLLLEDGRLQLDNTIQTYVPEFPEHAGPVTLRQLMGHVAGVRTDSGDEGPLFSVRCERPVDALPHFADRPLLFEPGTGYRYSSYGWILVSAAVEAAAGQPFLTVMRTRVFEPLGMDDTRAESSTESIPDRATFYFPRFAADPRYGLHLMRPLDYSCYAGASVFLSTPSDLVRFGIAMTGGSLLQPETVQVLQSSQRLRSGQETGYGLGWDLETVTLAGEPMQTIGHDGATLGGPVASLITVRRHGIVVAVTSNISYADTAALAVQIAEAFLPSHASYAPRRSSLGPLCGDVDQQSLVGLPTLALRDVLEEHATLRLSAPPMRKAELRNHWPRPRVRNGWIAARGDLPVDVEPEWFVLGRDLAHRPADAGHDAGLTGMHRT